MLDFTSSLYLGLEHAWAELPPFARLTTGRPAALAAPVASRSLARRLAALVGSEAAVVAPSTLHLFLDLCDWLARRPAAFLVDAAAYPIARWGVERALRRGAAIVEFAHHDARTMAALARRARRGGRLPVAVCDGFCPSCGAPAPLAAYHNAVRRAGGLLVVDDSQALGVLGPGAGRERPFGVGGSGTARGAVPGAREVLVVASLAKAFGAPLAMLAGAADRVRGFVAASASAVHSSPPSNAALLAARRALTVNRDRGEALRARLWRRVALFRRLLGRAGFEPIGGWFPAQSLALTRESETLRLAAAVHAAGARGVLTRQRCTGRPALTFLLTARHPLDEVTRLGRVLRRSRAAVAVGESTGPVTPGRGPLFEPDAAPRRGGLLGG